MECAHAQRRADPLAVGRISDEGRIHGLWLDVDDDRAPAGTRTAAAAAPSAAAPPDAAAEPAAPAEPTRLAGLLVDGRLG